MTIEELTPLERSILHTTVNMFFMTIDAYAPGDPAARLRYYRDAAKRYGEVIDLTQRTVQERLAIKIERGLI
jgi:hypothetical protein